MWRRAGAGKNEETRYGRLGPIGGEYLYLGDGVEEG